MVSPFVPRFNVGHIMSPFGKHCQFHLVYVEDEDASPLLRTKMHDKNCSYPCWKSSWYL